MHKLFVLYKLKLFTFLNFTLFISEKNIVNLKHNFGIEGSQEVVKSSSKTLCNLK